MKQLKAQHIKDMFEEKATRAELFQTVEDIKDMLAQNASNIALLKSKIETLDHDASYLSLFLELLITRLENKSPETKESDLSDHPPE